MSTVAELWALQVSDLAVETGRRRLAEIDDLLGETPELMAARQQVTSSQAYLDQWRKTQRDLETQVRELSQRILGAERDLMSGRVRNPKELEGMESNIASLGRRRSALEDEILEAMIEIETAGAELAQHQGTLATIEAHWQAEQAELQRERASLVAEVRTQAARLTQQWSEISPDDQRLYKDMRQRKGGRALARLERATCQACGVGLSTSADQQVRARQHRVFCPTCGRLLHSHG